MLNCYYALGGINYKNGVITTCPRQANQLVFANETILPSEIYNHKNFRLLRNKLHAGEWPSGCDTCEEMEKVGAKSMRLDYELNEENLFTKMGKPYEKFRLIDDKKLIDCYDNKSGLVKNEGLRHIEFRFSTACNFSCLHCSKVYSSGWTKKLKNYEPDEEVKFYDLRQLLGTEHRHGPNDKNEMRLSVDQSIKIVEDLNENFQHLCQVDFAGGELLYQKQFFPTLKKLSEHPNAKNLHISFHTNFNADFNVSELSQLLKPFGKNTIIISVDAGRSFYSYFRHGGHWDKLVENINEFKKLNPDRGKYEIIVSCTTSIYQMLDIYDVIDSFLELSCDFDASLVQTPKYLDPTLVNLEFAKETEQDIEKTYELLKTDKRVDSCRNAMYWFDYIVDYMKRFNPQYKEYNRFLIYRKKSDQIWGQNFNDYFVNYQIEDDELIRVK
tara:strand:- start:236 stop:1558 length:1323 start_codon:yes stop_codon:yes gene_type:complete